MTRSAASRDSKPKPARNTGPARAGARKTRSKAENKSTAASPIAARVAACSLVLLAVAATWNYPALEDAVARHAWSGAGSGAQVTAAAMPVCGWSRRVNCVVDGDTLWLEGEKIRLSNIDAPEVEGICPQERKLAARATYRLSALLSGRAIQVDRAGRDAYGRTLATIATARGDVGAVLVSEGLARPWGGRRLPWCGA